jgi:hypothetical protein
MADYTRRDVSLLRDSAETIDPWKQEATYYLEIVKVSEDRNGPLLRIMKERPPTYVSQLDTQTSIAEIEISLWKGQLCVFGWNIDNNGGHPMQIVLCEDIHTWISPNE